MYQNIQKRDAEERIKKSLQEKNILLKEIHHRVKNNLQIISSLLNLQSRSIDNEKYLNIFKESQNRIRTMALVHEKLYQSDDLGHINLPNYLYNVAMNLFHSYSSNSREIQLKTDIDDISLDIELAIPCGLIVNELISNSIKYAFPEDRHGKINLEVKLMNDELYEIVIKDDGIGIPDSISLEKTSSLGLQLVRALVNQINGEMSLFKNNGTKFVIKFNKHILDDKDINND
jgi:two-component sensor histidine kinase